MMKALGEIPLLRPVLAFLLGVAVVFLAMMFVLPPENIVRVLLVVLMVEPIIAGVGTMYVWYLWWVDKERPRSWLLFWLAFLMTSITLAALPVLWLAYRRLPGAPPLNPHEAAVIIGTSFAVIHAVPAIIAILLYMIRHGSLPPGPVPFDQGEPSKLKKCPNCGSWSEHE